MMYAYNERYMLPLSHDEVVHGKGSLIRKMHGDAPARFAVAAPAVRVHVHMPGRKLLFMGDEFGQVREWNHERALDWHLRDRPLHAGSSAGCARVARLYRADPALHELDHDPAGFEWLVVDDHQRSLIVYLRLPAAGPAILVALNFTPVTWTDRRIGLPGDSRWTLLARSDAPEFSDEPDAPASAQPDAFGVTHDPTEERAYALTLTMPPLTAVLLRGPDAAELRAATRRARAEKLAREAAAVVAAEAAALAPPATRDASAATTGEGAAGAASAATTGEGAASAATTGEGAAAEVLAEGKPDAPAGVGER
jgi:1,4-alpha-glucan branching enzyme